MTVGAQAAGFALAAAATVLSCGGEGAAAPSVGSTAPAPTATVAASTDACAVRTGGPGAPVPDPNGPYAHNMAIGRTSDGFRISETRQVLEHASVPDGVRMRDGSVLVYYVNGAQGYVWVARVTDSNGVLSTTPLGAVRLNGVDTALGVVDPDAFLLPDGRVRLTYLSGFGPPGGSTARAMCSAESDDGLSFTVVGTALQLTDSDSTDPSVIRLADGSFLMAHSRGQRSVISRSPDGRAFTTEQTVEFGGVPELALTNDGRVRLYVCSQGITSHVSSDAGRTWMREGVVVTGTATQRIVCDPSLVAGAGLFVYKTAP